MLVPQLDLHLRTLLRRGVLDSQSSEPLLDPSDLALYRPDDTSVRYTNILAAPMLVPLALAPSSYIYPRAVAGGKLA